MTDGDSEHSRPPTKTHGAGTALLIVGATFGLQGLTMVTGIISARILGVEGRGAIALVVALGLIASQLTFGGSVPIAIAKNLAERQVAGRDGLRPIVRRRWYLMFVPCLLAGGFMLILQRADAGGEKYALAAAVVVMGLQTMTFRIQVGCLQGEVGRLGRMAVVGLIPQAGFTVALSAAFFLQWDWDIFDVLLSFFASSFIGLVAAYLSMAKPTHRPEDALDERRLWTESRRTYIGSMRPVDSLGLDRILVGSLMGQAALGLYVAATAISNLCGIVGNAVSVIVLPQVAMCHRDQDAQRAVIRRWLGMTTVIVVGVVVVLELVVADAIRIAFGEEFVGAIDAARWLVLADGLLGFRKVLLAALQGQGRGGTASWIELLLMPLMVTGIVVSAAHDNLEAIGITMVVVGLVSVLSLGAVLSTKPARHKA